MTFKGLSTENPPWRLHSSHRVLRSRPLLTIVLLLVRIPVEVAPPTVQVLSPAIAVVQVAARLRRVARTRCVIVGTLVITRMGDVNTLVFAKLIGRWA